VPEEFWSAGGCLGDIPRTELFLDCGRIGHLCLLGARQVPVLRRLRQLPGVPQRQYPAEVSINTASFDDPAAFAPRMHIFAESRISWFHMADRLPSHTGFGGFHPADAGE
jgi:hypothetical protein